MQRRRQHILCKSNATPEPRDQARSLCFTHQNSHQPSKAIRGRSRSPRRRQPTESSLSASRIKPVPGPGSTNHQTFRHQFYRHPQPPPQPHRRHSTSVAPEDPLRISPVQPLQRHKQAQSHKTKFPRIRPLTKTTSLVGGAQRPTQPHVPVKARPPMPPPKARPVTQPPQTLQPVATPRASAPDPPDNRQQAPPHPAQQAASTPASSARESSATTVPASTEVDHLAYNRSSSNSEFWRQVTTTRRSRHELPARRDLHQTHQVYRYPNQQARKGKGKGDRTMMVCHRFICEVQTEL